MKALQSVIICVVMLTLNGHINSQLLPEGPYVQSDLTLKIVILYPESQLTSASLTTDLYIVGNGLGLVWNQPHRLTKSAKDTWTLDINFTGSWDGYVCSTLDKQPCTNKNSLPPQDRFEYRIMTSNSGDMIGPNFGLSLHLSKMETYFGGYEHKSYPYFFTRKSNLGSMNVSSTDLLIRSRRWNYIIPPSFAENPYKTYPTLFVIDIGLDFIEPLRLLLEKIWVDKAIAEEQVIIGSGDYDIPGNNDGRGTLLTPTPGINWECAQGTYADQCGNCIPTGASGRAYIEAMRDGCGIPTVTGGHGEQYLNHFVNEVLPAVRTVLGNRIMTDRNHLGISGCSLGGLLSCHALYTRQQTFGFGACQSSSFWWPSEINADNGFYFLNNTLKSANYKGTRLPQKVFVDVTEPEDDPYYAQIYASLTVTEQLQVNSPQFRQDESLWFSLVYGQKHGSWNCLTRTWQYLSLFTPPGGAPRNPNPPTKHN